MCTGFRVKLEPITLLINNGDLGFIHVGRESVKNPTYSKRLSENRFALSSTWNCRKRKIEHVSTFVGPLEGTKMCVCPSDVLRRVDEHRLRCMVNSLLEFEMT